MFCSCLSRHFFLWTEPGDPPTAGSGLLAGPVRLPCRSPLVERSLLFIPISPCHHEPKLCGRHHRSPRLASPSRSYRCSCDAAFWAAGQMQSHNACSLSAASACLTGGRFRNQDSESRPQVPPWASRKAGMSPGEADAGQSLRTGSSLTPPPVSHAGFPDSCSAARAFRKRRRRLAFCVLLSVP